MEQHDIGTRKDLASYRLETAKLLLAAGQLKAANNRSYYAILNAINAIHALNGAAYKRHKDAIANFNKDYVKTSIFPRAMRRRIAQAEEIRHASDYNDFFVASKAEAEEQISTAEEFICMAEQYCKGKC